MRRFFPDIKVEEDGASFSHSGAAIKVAIPAEASSLRQSCLLADAYRLHIMAEEKRLQDEHGKLTSNYIYM